MKFPTTKFIACASTDQTRYVLNGAYFDVENKRLVVTDGRRMVLLPAEPEPGDVSGIVPTEAVTEALRLAKKPKGKKTGSDPDGGLAGITINGVVKLRNGAEFPKVEGIYPNYAQVIPDYVKLRMQEKRTEEEQTVVDRALDERTTIAFNARMLFEMAQAMGSDSVVLEMVKSKDGGGGVNPMPEIVVRPGNNEAVHGAVGVLMPMRMS